MESRFEMETKRMLKGKALLERSVPTAASNWTYKTDGEKGFYVQSQSNTTQNHLVRNYKGSWFCDCEDYKNNKANCKHIWAVIFSLEQKAKETKTINPVDNVECPVCHSHNFKKWGVRHNKADDLQLYRCEYCGKRFSVNIGFEQMKHNPKAITAAMQLYFSGESLRNTMKSLRLLGCEVSHQTVANWIEKYTLIMKKYADNLTPNVSDTWRADEVFVRVKGDIKYLFALMDDETRYIIAQEVAETKDRHDAGALFHKGSIVAGKKPQLIITDGLPAYHAAFNKEYYGEGRRHLNTIKLTGKHNNNRMERVNGEIRDREKTMRGLKKNDTTILQGYQIYHNFIKTHEGLDGKTPAEACGIKVNGENKWMTLIQNASQKVKTG